MPRAAQVVCIDPSPHVQSDVVGSSGSGSGSGIDSDPRTYERFQVEDCFIKIKDHIDII